MLRKLPVVIPHRIRFPPNTRQIRGIHPVYAVWNNVRNVMRVQNVYFTSYTMTCGNFSWNDLHVEKWFFRNPFENLRANLQEQPAMDKHRIVGRGLLYKGLQGWGGGTTPMYNPHYFMYHFDRKGTAFSPINLKTGTRFTYFHNWSILHINCNKGTAVILSFSYPA